ncbi:MAG: hypothetical protein U0S12_12835 [Fimbriimonadales bacterium]
MNPSRTVREQVGRTIAQMGFQRTGRGRWSKVINGDITLGIDFDIVNNSCDRFTSAQVTVSSTKLQSLHDPGGSVGMSITYACISVAQHLSNEGHLAYPDSEETALNLVRTITDALKTILSGLEPITDGEQLLSYIYEHPATSMVSAKVLSYFRALLAGEIDHKQFPNWRAYANHLEKSRDR